MALQAGHQMTIDRIYVYREASRLTQWTLWLAYGQIIMASLMMLMGCLELQLISDMAASAFPTEDALAEAQETNDLRQGVVGLVGGLIMLISSIVTLMWIHRSNYNAHAFGAKGMEFTPGWAVGWYFIPVAAMWKPYQSMREMWKVSKNPENWKELPTPSFLRWWWGVWIFSGVINNYSLFQLKKIETEGINSTSTLINGFADLTNVVSAIILVMLVKQLSAMQTAQRAQRPGVSGMNTAMRSSTTIG